MVSLLLGEVDMSINGNPCSYCGNELNTSEGVICLCFDCHNQVEAREAHLIQLKNQTTGLMASVRALKAKLAKAQDEIENNKELDVNHFKPII